jgi:hypothetical protein
VPKDERLFTAEQGAFMTRLTMSSFRTKVSKLGIKGTKQGRKVYYTRKQLEAIHEGKVAKTVKTAKAKKRVKKVSKAKR